MVTMEESKLIFSLDRRDEGSTVVFSKGKPQGRESQPDLSFGMDLNLSQGHRSQPSFLPHSPSSPGSLADLSASSAALLHTTNLVKPSSTDLEPSESASPRGKPLLSLVKSLSTDISWRVEQEVNLSKSDSKLHLYTWKQFTHPKIPEAKPEAGDLNVDLSWASPPAEPRGSSLIAELEGTRRKFSEAMQDPLSMLSKIIGEESSSSPKQGRFSGAGDLLASPGGCGRDAVGEEVALKCRRRAESEHRGVYDTPVRSLQQGSSLKSPPEYHSHSTDSSLEIRTYEDSIQVLEFQDGSRGSLCQSQSGVKAPGSSLPLHWLVPVGLLAYSFFVLPLPSYLTALSVGVACGFMFGLVVVLMFALRHASARPNKGTRFSKSKQLTMDALDGDPGILEGWMNETHTYDPETFHLSVTYSVYVTLEGSRLRLGHPRTNVPRRAGFDEAPHEALFRRSRTYRLANSKVSLLPHGLAHKRLWNRKYPICITLAEGEVGEETVVQGQEKEEKEEEEEEEDRAERHTITNQQLPVTLYLYGRTGREKEEWFQRLQLASRAGASRDECTEARCGGDAVKEIAEGLHDLAGALKTRTILDYSNYMTQLIAAQSGNPIHSPCNRDKESPRAHKKVHNEVDGSGGQAGPTGSEEGGSSAEGQPAWVNSLVGRIFWDFLREKYWTDQVAQKIQKKLSKIKLPYFMNELKLADLDMGACLPQVLSTSKPTVDGRGLWLELELTYTGGLQMTLETKMNLCKLGKDGEDEAHSVLENQQVGPKPKLCILADSDEESSSAGSSDEEEAQPSEPQGSVGDRSTVIAAEGHTGESTSRKILRFVDKIAKSKYFQRATENEYIKKKIADLSNMPLMLSVEVLELSGTLAINIPPPPTDRIWYSFRVPPRLNLHVRPTLGEREVTITHVTEWIEKKLQCEFQKVLVMPNMDDLYLPLMTSGLENPPAAHQSSVHFSSHQSSMESQDYLSE